MFRHVDPRHKPPPGSLVDWSHPWSQGLVGFWLLNDGGAHVHDITRHGYGGAVTGTALTTAGGNSGGLCLSRADVASADGVQMDNAWTTGTTFSWECLLNLTVAHAGGTYDPLWVNASGANGIYLISGRQLDWYDGNDRLNNTFITVGAWTHFVLTVNAGTWQWYFNAVADSTFATAVTSKTLDTAFSDRSTNQCPCKLDRMRWWNRVLTAEEIRGLLWRPYENVLPPVTARWFLPAAGGSQITRTASDSPSTTDSVTRVFVGARTASDSPSTTDSVSRVFVGARTATAAPTTTDTLTRVFVGVRSAADSPTTTDSISRVFVGSRTTSDSPATTDTVTRSLTLFRTAADSPSTTDSVTAIKTKSIAASDAPTTTDSVTRAFVGARSATDAPTTTDALARVFVGVRTATDAPSTTDALVRSLAATRSVADTPTTTDAVSRVFTGLRSAPDAPSTVDSVTRVFVGARTAADAPTTIDSVTAVKTKSIAASDSPVTTDSVVRTAVLTRTATDSPQTTEVVTTTGGHPPPPTPTVAVPVVLDTSLKESDAVRGGYLVPPQWGPGIIRVDERRARVAADRVMGVHTGSGASPNREVLQERVRERRRRRNRGLAAAVFLLWSE